MSDIEDRMREAWEASINPRTQIDPIRYTGPAIKPAVTHRRFLEAGKPSMRELGKMLNLSPTTVKAHIHRVRQERERAFTAEQVKAMHDKIRTIHMVRIRGRPALYRAVSMDFDVTETYARSLVMAVLAQCG